MTAELPEAPDNNQPGNYEHGPEPARRTPRSEYTEDFLRRLQVTGKVRPVSEDWDRNSLNLPPHFNWVIYPNDDLERIGFD
jgi:hypothetical protein